MKQLLQYITVGIILVANISALSCAPATAPFPATTPLLTQSPPDPAGVPKSSPSLSPDEVAWQKVEETAKKEQKVNVYSYNMTGDVAIAVSRSFEQKYGIRLEIITGGGAALAERIMTEKRMGTVVADIMDANTFQIGHIKDAGATTTSQEIPVLREKVTWVIEPWANDPQKHILIHTLLYRASIINTNLVKLADEPKSLKDLVKPKWQGRMVQTDARISSGPSIYFLTLLQKKLADQDTVREIGKGTQFTPTDDESAKMLIQGRYALIPGRPTRAVSPFMVQEPNLPVKAVDIEEGTVVNGNAMAAIDNSPHPNGAKLLINWLLTKEGQSVFIKLQGSTPVRKDVPDYLPASLRFTPTRIVIPTIEEERESTRLFREGWLAKLWGR